MMTDQNTRIVRSRRCSVVVACLVAAIAILLPPSTARSGEVLLMSDEGIGYFDYFELDAASTHIHYETDWTEWNRSGVYLYVGGQIAYYSASYVHEYVGKRHLSTGSISTTSGGWHGGGWVAGSDMDIHIKIDDDEWDPWGDTLDRNNELLLIDVQKTDVSGAMSSTGSTLVLQFKIDIGNSAHGNRELDRLWVKNAGTLEESATELTNGIVQLYYESGTNALSFDGSESKATLYGDYATSSTNNGEFGHNDLNITITNGEGLNCYVVVSELPDGSSLVGKTAQFKIIQNGMGLDLFGVAAGGGAGLVKIDEHINANVQEVPPALSGGDHRMKITFGGYDKGEILTNFPALLVFSEDLDAFSYTGFSSPNGYDLRFSTADEGTELNYEIETWSTTSNSYVWVQVPELTNGAYIWAYWGDSSYTAQPESQTNGAVWDSNYVGVWHLEELFVDEVASGTHDDSTANNNDGSQSYNGKTTGVISGGQVFDGDDQISVTDANSLDVSTITASAWIKTSTKDVTSRRIVDKRNNSGYALHMAGDSSGTAYASFNDNGIVSGSDIADGEWHQVVGTYDGSTESLYIDGTLETNMSWSGTISANADQLTLGRNQSTVPNTEGFIGAIDEVRISNLDRGSNWVWASYMTVASNGTFTSYGEVEKGEDDTQQGSYFLVDAHAYGDMPLSFVENFDNKSLGGLNMINDWLTSPTAEVDVQSDVSFRGGKALRLNEATAWHGFTDTTATNVWVDFYAMPVQRASDPTMPSTATAGFYVNTSGRIVAYSNTTWVILSDSVTISADAWYRFTLNMDYGTRQWAIYVADDTANVLSTTLATNLPLKSGTTNTSFTSFRMKN